MVLTYLDAEKAYKELVNSLDIHDMIDMDIYNELLATSIRYAKIRSEWSTVKDRPHNARIESHNAFIIVLNMLERHFDQTNRPTHWRNIIGRDSEGEERKTQGDFACYIAYDTALKAR